MNKLAIGSVVSFWASVGLCATLADLTSGTQEYIDEGFIDVSVKKIKVGEVYPKVAKMIVGGNTVISAGDSQPIGVGISLGIHPNWPNAQVRGMLFLNEGAIISNRVASVEQWDSPTDAGIMGQGSFVLNGGTYYSNDSGWGYAMVGKTVGGFVQLLKGKWRSNNWAVIGHNSGSYGVVEALGGQFRHEGGALGIGGYGGNGHLYFGGKSTGDVSRADFGFAVWGNAANTSGAHGTLTVDGDAVAKIDSLNVGAAGDSVSVVNLNGGTLQVKGGSFDQNALKFTNSRQLNNNTSQELFDIANNHAYLNFNGGAIQFDSSFGAWRGYRFDRATVYKGGARIMLQTVGGSAGSYTLYQGLRKPTGKGIGEIPVPTAAAWEYTGAPYVEISGDGFGASALAQFDVTSGMITNVLVTSPGCDYTWAKATFRRGGAQSEVEVDLSDYLVENDPTGGLVVEGPGNLTWAANNPNETDYEGPTVIGEGATVKVWSCSEHYPAKSHLRMEGGTILLGTSRGETTLDWISLPSMGGYGTVKANSLSCEGFEFDAADIVSGRILSVENIADKIWNSNKASVVIRNAAALDALEATDPENKRFVLMTCNKGFDKTSGENAPVLQFDSTISSKWKLEFETSKDGSQMMVMKRTGLGLVLLFR